MSSISINAELARLQRKETEEARKVKEAKKKSQTTERTSNQRVKSLNKSQSRAFVGGGATIYNAEINPIDFIPNSKQNPQKSIPDYYRNGRLIQKTTLVNGDLVTRAEFSPIPELVGERSSPVLASIRLVDPNKLKNTGPTSSAVEESLLIPSYSKFFLEGVQEAHNEKYQTVETFNDWYIYFYGEKPPIYQFSGHLLNFSNYNWKNEFMYFYQNFWRGTKCAELGARIFLTYDYQQIQGYILNISTNVNALTDKAAPFNFAMIVTKRLIFNGTADDKIVRDNLLPRTDSGLINTEANSFSLALTKDFLDGQRPPFDVETASADKNPLGERLLADNASSVQRQIIPNAGALSPTSPNSIGSQRSTNYVNKLALS